MHHFLLTLVLLLTTWLAATAPAKSAEPTSAKPLAGVERDVRVQQYIESAQQKREAGDFDQALVDLRAANAIVKKTRGDGHPDQLVLLDLAAEMLVENDKMQEAEGPLQKAVGLREALVREGQSSQEVPLAASLLLLGKVHASLGKYESVVDMLKKAVRMLDTSLGPEHEKTFQARRELAHSVEIFEETLGPEHPATLKALEELAAVQAALGDWTGASANARKIIGMKRAKLGAANPETLGAVIMLTDLIGHGGASDDAIKIQAEAVAAAEEADAPAAVVVPSLRHLAALYLANEDYSPAIDAYTRSRDLAAAHLGADGAEPLIDRLHLVDVAQKRGDDDPWDAGFETIVARLRELAVQDDPRAAEGLRLAAGALLAADAFDRASELFREALAIDERMLGPAHVDVAADQTGLGRCLVGNGDTKAAEAILRTALQTMQREHGPAHAATLEVLVRIAECAVRAGDAKTAEQCVTQILERQVPRQGAHAEEEFCRLVDTAAGLCEKAGDASKGGAIRDRLVSIRRAQFGESHEHVAAVFVSMANARQAVRDYAAATAMYEAGIAIYEAALGADHPDIAAALLPLSRAYRATGKNEDAERALRRALGIWEATVGPDHEVTLATVKPLAIVLLALEREAEAIPLMERLVAGLDADPNAEDAEKVKLLTKLAEVRESIGAADLARRDLRRAIELEMRLADTGRTGSATDLADIARLQQLLGDEEAAAENLARARDMAAKLPDAKDQIAKIEAKVKPARKPAAAAPTADTPAPPPTLSAAAMIAAARSKYRLGKRNEARGIVEKAISDLPTGSDRNLERADLLVALADLRQRTTDYDTAAVLYEEAHRIAIDRGRSSSPLALVIALRLLGIRQAQGEEAAVTSLVDEVEKGAKQVFAGGPSAEALDELREAVRRAEAVSLAVGDRKSARRLLEIGIAVAGQPDRRATLAALDTLALLLASGRSSAATALRTRLLDAALLNARRDDPLSARFIFHRGVAAEQAGDLAAAERDFRQALALDEATHGRDHPLVAVDLLRLAAVRELGGDRAEATDARGRALAIANQSARAASPDATADLRMLAVALGTAGETDAATKLIKAVVDARLKSDGAKSIEVAQLLADSADIFKLRGNTARASELLTEAMAIADSVVGAGHHETLALAAKLEQLKRFGASDQFATRTSVPLATGDAGGASLAEPQAPPAPAVTDITSEARVAPPAPRDPDIDTALAEIAATAAAGRLPAALTAYKELGQRTWKTHGVDDPRVAQVAVPYAHLLVECGDLRKARTIADRAVAVRTNQLGDDHPETAAAVLAAAAADAATGKIGQAWAGYDRARGIVTAADWGLTPAATVQALVAIACELGDVATAIDGAGRFLGDRPASGASPEATAIRVSLCEALLAAGLSERAVAAARDLVPKQAPDEPARLEDLPALALLARAEQAAGLSEWSRTATAAETALEPALESASPDQCVPGLIRAGRELALAHTRAGNLARGRTLAERTAAAATRALPERHRERFAAERVLAELVLESGSPDRAASLLQTTSEQAIDSDIREAVLRHFATAATLPF